VLVVPKAQATEVVDERDKYKRKAEKLGATLGNYESKNLWQYERIVELEKELQAYQTDCSSGILVNTPKGPVSLEKWQEATIEGLQEQVTALEAANKEANQQKDEEKKRADKCRYDCIENANRVSLIDKDYRTAVQRHNAALALLTVEKSALESRISEQRKELKRLHAKHSQTEELQQKLQESQAENEKLKSRVKNAEDYLSGKNDNNTPLPDWYNFYQYSVPRTYWTGMRI
jgi:chromosome segregation ATPase